jgi:hypothetical protein
VHGKAAALDLNKAQWHNYPMENMALRILSAPYCLQKSSIFDNVLGSIYILHGLTHSQVVEKATQQIVSLWLLHVSSYITLQITQSPDHYIEANIMSY